MGIICDLLVWDLQYSSILYLNCEGQLQLSLSKIQNGSKGHFPHLGHVSCHEYKTDDLMELLLIYQEKTHLIQFYYFSKSKCLNLQENDLIIILSNTAVIFLALKMISSDSMRLKCGKSQRIM